MSTRQNNRQEHLTRFNSDLIEEARRLHDEGMSFRMLGIRYGVSGQRVHQVLTGYRSPSNWRAHGAVTWTEAVARSLAGQKHLETPEQLAKAIAKRSIATPETIERVVARVRAIRQGGL